MTLAEALAAEERGEGAVRFVDGIPAWVPGARVLFVASSQFEAPERVPGELLKARRVIAERRKELRAQLGALKLREAALGEDDAA